MSKFMLFRINMGGQRDKHKIINEKGTMSLINADLNKCTNGVTESHIAWLVENIAGGITLQAEVTQVLKWKKNRFTKGAICKMQHICSDRGI